MDERVKSIYKYVQNKEHHMYRKTHLVDFSKVFFDLKLSPTQRMTTRFQRVLSMEKPVVMLNERITFQRTVTSLPKIFTKNEWDEIKHKHFIHELGYVCNICPNYADVISSGLESKLKIARIQLKKCESSRDLKGKEFLESVIKSITALFDLTDRYQKEAARIGNNEVAEILLQVPRYKARTFHEALQFFRILHFALWCEGEYHNTIGRFDQYMYPYLLRDMEKGLLDEDTALEFIEEFFISFNKDSDLYPGVQQGDNGQSLVLGGVDKNGNNSFNLLSKLCLKASKELKLIDPKINLRVNKDTDLSIFELGTELTEEGLGFPQYSNDDIIIPGLISRGYKLEDARDYAMAACWETIIPGYGMDIPNIGALSYPKIVDESMHNNLLYCKSFDEFLCFVKEDVRKNCNMIAKNMKNLWMLPAPFMSVLMNDCIENVKDISLGCRYNNFGLHGTGISTAADSLAAIKKYVFDSKIISAKEFIKAVDQNFNEYGELLETLRNRAPKMGNNDDYVDNIAIELFNSFVDALKNLKNERGGLYRAGTGSAMYYLWHAKEIGASADGRMKGEAFGANYSPSLFAKLKGPISVIESFTKPNLSKAINGGPLTMEFHENIFRDAESKRKVAMLVKSFIILGGNQLQLNAVNRETLLDAQKKPEEYKNLIVRVWGWSAYFVALDKEYQDHIIKRNEFE